MSNINCFVTQLAKKCATVLDSCEQAATENDCEVTLLLMAASAGVIVPYERLIKKPKGLGQPVNDDAHNSEAVKKMQKLLDQRFLISEVWKTENKTWKTGILTCLMDAKNEEHLPKDKWPHPGDWTEPKTARLMDDTVTVREVVECIRHALAHGNIYTDPDATNKIETLVFATGTGTEGGVSKKGKIIEANPFRFVSVSVPEFRLFLVKWFKRLEKLPMIYPMSISFYPQQEEDDVMLSAA